MSESTTERLLPCSGRTLAEVIHSTARREYDEQRDQILVTAAGVILDILKISEEEWDLVLKADAIFKRTIKLSSSTSNIHQSFKQVCNSALMPVSNWNERLEQKLDEFFRNISLIRNSELAQFDTRVADIFRNIESASLVMSRSELCETIYRALEDSRRDKSGISTRMSRIRKVAEYVLEPSSHEARELGEIEVKSPNDASVWLTDVANAFIAHKESASKFAASYEKPWQDHGHMVIERNEKDKRQLYSRNSLRNVHLIERLLTSKIEDSLTSGLDFNYNQTEEISDRTKFRLSNSPRKPADFSKSMTAELKTGGDRFEAHFTFPDFVATDLPEFQITLLEAMHKKFSGLDSSISTHFSPSPTIVLCLPKMDMKLFSGIYREATTVLAAELKKWKNSN